VGSVEWWDWIGYDFSAMSNAVLEISTDPGEIAAARTEWAAERERRLSGNLANRHDLMLLDLAKISAGRFRPEAALERYDSNLPDLGPGDPGHWIPNGVGEYFVQFIHGNRLYRFQPDDMGRWRDVKAVITAVHRALADASVDDRYSALEGTGDMAVFVFAKPGPLKSVAS